MTDEFIRIEGCSPVSVDEDGHLSNLADWDHQVAKAIAHREGIELTEAHWEILLLLREFYTEFDLSPAMRPFVKYISQKLGTDKGRSIYLLQLFPGSPTRIASKIAGLPKPTNCL